MTARKLAYDYGNQEIEQEHLLVALLSQEDGLIPKLIDKMEINVEHFTENTKRHLAARKGKRQQCTGLCGQ